GDVAAAVGVMERDAGPREHFGAGEQVIEMAVAAERDYVWMLDDQQMVGDLAALALIGEICLYRQRFGVWHHAEMAELTAAFAMGGWQTTKSDGLPHGFRHLWRDRIRC